MGKSHIIYYALAISMSLSFSPCLFLSLEFRHHLRSQAVEITKQSHDLEKTISAGNISSLIDGNGEVKPGVTRTIQTLLSSPAPELDSLADVADFVK